MEQYVNRYRMKFETMSSSMEDMMTMMGVTRAHGLERHELSKVENRIDDVFASGRKLDILIEVFGASGWISFTLLQVTVLLGSIYFAIKGVITIGDVVIFQAFFMSISFSVLGLVQTLPMVAQARESMTSIGELLNAPDLEDNRDKPVENVDGAFDLQDVCFQYPATAHHALNGINLSVPVAAAACRFS